MIPAPSTFFSGTSDLSALISEQNTVHPMSNADLYGATPAGHIAIKATMRNDEWVPAYFRVWRNEAGCHDEFLGFMPLNNTTEERDERASAR